MTTDRPAPPTSVPTLTEVVPWPASGAAEPAKTAGVIEPPATDGPDSRGNAALELGWVAVESDTAAAAGVPDALPLVGDALPAGPRVLDEERLTQRILQDVERQIGEIVEYRVREALTPILTRLSDALVREARTELASTLRDVVARSVAQEMRRQRIG